MLKIRELRKSFPQPMGGSVCILDIPAFDMPASEQLVLRGESGSGKTTLLQIISGISQADEGTVEIDSTNISGLSEAARDRFRAAKIGFVFQTFNLLPAFTALENVRLGMTFGRGKYSIDRARDLLSQVGLSDRMNYHPSQLSVGQQQRVSVARALANRPRLLLADEPTANVDPANQQRIIDLLREVCSHETVGLFLVTHSDLVAKQFERVEELNRINRASQTAGVTT